MTVCIAAIAEYKYVVTGSDTKLTTGHYSQDLGALKLRPLHKRWRALIAGAFAHHHYVYWPIVRSLRRQKEDEVPKLREVESSCVDAYISANRKLAEEGILSSYGMNLDQFLKSRTDLGDSLYEQIWNEIRKAKIGCDLLVGGFDEADYPTLFIVANPTQEHLSFITHCDDPGFGVIGSGAYLAESTLYAMDHSAQDSLADTICRVAFAKFAAESASDVGESTWIVVFDVNRNEFILQAELLHELRKQWETKGKPRIPQSATDSVSEQIASFVKRSTSET